MSSLPRSLAYAALAAALCGTSAAHAFTRERSEYGANLKWAASTFTVTVDGSFSAAERAAIERAAATWSATSCVAVTVGTVGTVLDVVDVPRTAAVVDARSAAVSSKSGQVIAVARGKVVDATFAAHTEPHVANARTGVVDRATITIDGARTFSADASAFDLESVVLHELGHAIGLAHPVGLDVGHDVVMRAGVKPGEKRRTLSADDVAGVCAIYPR